MKFKVLSKEDGLMVKELILSKIRTEGADAVVNVYEVNVAADCGIGDYEPKFTDYERYWCVKDLLHGKIRIRHTRDGWFMYLPEPNEPEFDTEPCEEKSEDDVFLEKLYERCVDLLEAMSYKNDGRRKCMVWRKSKKKGVLVEEFPCWFHCWSGNRITKDDGSTVDQLLAVCEFQDGHVERVNFDHIRFVEEWD